MVYFISELMKRFFLLAIIILAANVAFAQSMRPARAPREVKDSKVQEKSTASGEPATIQKAPEKAEAPVAETPRADAGTVKAVAASKSQSKPENPNKASSARSQRPATAAKPAKAGRPDVGGRPVHVGKPARPGRPG